MIYFDIQLFAESGAPADAGGGQAAAVGNSGMTEMNAPDITGDTAAGQNAGERLPYSEIREMYREEFDGEMKNTVEKRLKKAGRDSANLKKAERVISRAFRQYGIADGDYDALEKAVAADEDYYNELSLKNGTTPEVERRLEEAERSARENAEQLRQREEADELRQQYAEISRNVQEAKAVYPDFDLSAEMENPVFAQWARIPGVKFIDAYRAAHFDELSGRAAAASASAAAIKTVNSVMSGTHRPTENGMTTGAAAETRTDPSRLTLKEIDAIIDEAKRGIKRSFG